MMNTQRLMIIFAVMVTVATAAWIAATTQFQQKAEPVAIAVIDVSRVFNDCKERADIRRNFTLTIQEAETEREEQKKKIRDLKDQLDMINATASPEEFKQTHASIRKGILERDFNFEFRKTEVAREQILRDEGLYRKIVQACEDVSRANGFRMVLFKEAAQLAPVKNHGQLLNQMAARKVLWVSEELDITDQVIQTMDNAWSIGRPSGP